ncbi:vitellogenin-2-like isoform X1 [Canna indica]|uniref:Vitellogenin-2-like isoform X1 n=1 Tax=Canna indica TaxID=4628 RepID=A0AAQ3QQG1_9LILI|nr:vitellogenin-2-like isoform X1 [Canna indica]
MSLTNVKGKLSNRKSIQEKCFDNKDHWAFLEEIEAPMWADLTVEAQLEEDIDDTWFRVTHPIHQMSSLQLKKSIQGVGKDGLLNLKCHSPKVPDSVSKSRGKCYKSRKWLGSVHGSSVIKDHPVRKLGRVSMGEVRKKTTSQNSSVSTVTISSSTRKPSRCLVSDNCNSFVESNAKAEESSSSNVISKCRNLRPKTSLAGPKNTSYSKRGTSQIAGRISREIKISDLRVSNNARYSTKKTEKVEPLLQNYHHSAGKSSVGSSSSVGSMLENGSSTKMMKNKRVKGFKLASVAAAKVLETNTKSTTQSIQHQNKAGGSKVVCRETKSKVLGPSAPRKPLAQLNGSGQQRNIVVAKPRIVAGSVKNHLKPVRNKENTIEGKLQCPRYVKPKEVKKREK